MPPVPVVGVAMNATSPSLLADVRPKPLVNGPPGAVLASVWTAPLPSPRSSPSFPSLRRAPKVTVPASSRTGVRIWLMVPVAIGVRLPSPVPRHTPVTPPIVPATPTWPAELIDHQFRLLPDAPSKTVCSVVPLWV
jgi:hypothetical protein